MEAKTSCSHSSSRSEQLRSYRDSIRPLVGDVNLQIQNTARVLPFQPGTSLCRTLLLHSHLRPEGLRLLQLRLCRCHHRDPGSRKFTSRLNTARSGAKPANHLALLHVTRENEKSTHWSSVHRGVVSSVALEMHEEHNQMRNQRTF